MKNKKIKLSDVARELNVSVSLVSLVMSGKWKDNRISEKLSEKVLKTAKEMGYQPNTTARALRTGKSGVIGLVVADISNPFYGKIARTIENEASKYGYQLMFGSSDEKLSKFKLIVDTLISRQVDGLIVVPVNGSEKFLEQKHKQGVPIVLVDRNFENTKLPYVVDDGIYGGEQLTRLLLNKGLNKVATVVFESELSNYKERVEAFVNTVKFEKSGKIESVIIEVPSDKYEDILEKKILQAIKNNVKGFFFTQNKIGIEGIKIFRKNNIKIPEDVAIVSYDNPEIFELGSPTISCYQQSIDEISYHTVSIISKLLNNDKYTNAQLRIKGTHIERESTDF
ncbi:MAG: LacI family DNA-binding transcriptional regulator [Bacteroidota bacterium]